MFNQDRYERTDPAGIEQAVLLVHHVLNAFPGQRGKPCRKPVHHVSQCPQLLAYSHRESVRVPTNAVKT